MLTSNTLVTILILFIISFSTFINHFLSDRRLLNLYVVSCLFFTCLIFNVFSISRTIFSSHSWDWGH